jgi:hypothetical protein
MKTFLTIVTVLILTACNGITKTRTTENIDGTTFDIIEVDSCEYLVATRAYRGYMAHKGNCKYCEQRRKKWR